MSKLASLGLLLALLSPAEPALAVPHVYSDVVLGVNDLMACVENARKVASKNGFSDDVQVLGTGRAARCTPTTPAFPWPSRSAAAQSWVRHRSPSPA